jgi:CHAT domain-containing protein/tetratricopeptide (TPR) repeat protein
MARQKYGENHKEYALAILGLSGVYRDQGRYAEAEPLLKLSLAIFEKKFGLEDPLFVVAGLNNLAGFYREQGRDAEAEPLFKRSLAVIEKKLGAENSLVIFALSGLGNLYVNQGRYAAAEPLLKRSVAISEKIQSGAELATALNSLGLLYRIQGRYAEAEPLFKRSLAIPENKFGPKIGPDHAWTAFGLDNLASLYFVQGHYVEAEPLFKRSLAIYENVLGAEHPHVVGVLANLAVVAGAHGDWAQAADYWRRSTNVIERRAERGLALAGAGSVKGEAVRNGWHFSGLVKTTDRLTPEGHTDRARQGREMFETAQWAQSSEAAGSLTQMAARGAKGDDALAGLVRERQDLVGEWQSKDKLLIAAKSEAPAKRDPNAEKVLSDRLAAIDGRLKIIGVQFARDFPEYASLTSPKPASVAEVQALLQPNEALVLFLDTSEWKSSVVLEETFIWVVTKSDFRWVRSDLGTVALIREVAALRCGLDYDGTWGVPGSRCPELLNTNYTETDHMDGKSLPFDLARANALYKALFGQVEDLIARKHLLIVPSGALMQLPFQVLVTALSNDVASGEHLREVGFLGAEVSDLTPDARHSLKLPARSGVAIGKLDPSGAAEQAGLKPGDILLSIDGKYCPSVQHVIDAIRARGPGAKVQLRVSRAGRELELTARLTGNTLREWIPRLLGAGEGKDIKWLARDHPLTVLPSVSSLKALRQLAKESHASRIVIGFGNPLLNGPDAGYFTLAAAARSKASCPESPKQRVAALTGVRRGVLPLSLRSGLADAGQILSQVPLPETADELCAVAGDLGASDKDVWLGERATEAEIKRLSEEGELAKYHIIHFATHGTLAGQVGGSSEPGLILTPPKNATARDDGYLSASEVASLKLDADWVILSACNTAAGNAQGTEALSGLARAFFYAGARALLVSHWAVASDATVKLITGAVGRMASDKRIGRAEAMRQSMIALIDKGEAYEAHPAYWAPFVVVGEGAAPK